MAAAAPIPDSNVCFAELIVRLDSLLTLREEEQPAEEEKEAVQAELEADVKLKLSELHLRLKNGGAIQDHSGVLDDDDDDDEDEAVDDSQGPASANEGGAGSVDCVGCSSAEDEDEVCPSPIEPKGMFSCCCCFCFVVHVLVVVQKSIAPPN
jgi:hypothetical protein